MARRLARHLRGNLIAYLALFVALGGTSYAAVRLPANSVDSKQIRKGAVTLTKISTTARANLKGRTGATGAKGDTGAQGPPGPTAAAFTQGWFDQPLTTAATVLPPRLATGSGRLSVGFPARLLVRGTVQLYKTAAQAPLTGRVACRVERSADADTWAILGSSYATLGPSTAGTLVSVALPLSAAADVPAGTYDLRIVCWAPAMATDGTATPGASGAALDVVAARR